MSQQREFWSRLLATRVGERVRAHRTRQGISAQALADRTALLGHEIKRSVIAEMENGKRSTIPLADVLALARALDVPPTFLIFPPDLRREVELLPGQFESPWTAVDWFTGERELSLVAPWVESPEEAQESTRQWKSVTEPVQLRRDYERSVMAANGHSLWADIYQNQANVADAIDEKQRLKTLAIRETELAVRSEQDALSTADELRTLRIEVPKSPQLRNRTVDDDG